MSPHRPAKPGNMSPRERPPPDGFRLLHPLPAILRVNAIDRPLQALELFIKDEGHVTAGAKDHDP